jgi:RNA recognition motif-containing protein
VISPKTSAHDPNGRNYYAFVDVATKEEAVAAIEALDGTTAFGGPIKVDKARSEGSKKVDERQKFGQ